MELSGLRLEVWSNTAYEFLIVEIYREHEYIGLIHQEKGPEQLVVEFAANTGAQTRIEYDWLLGALQAARAKLLCVSEDQLRNSERKPHKAIE